MAGVSTTARRSAIVVALLALCLQPAQAAEVPVWQGVWQGTVGKLPVRVCLAHRSSRDGFGAYYYLRHLRLIGLSPHDDGDGWSEHPPKGKPAEARWTFETVTPTLLTGRWTQATRSLPVRLARVEDTGSDAPCASMAFNGPRFSPSLRREKAMVGGVAHTRLVHSPGASFAEVEIVSFELNGAGAAIGRINALLRNVIPADTARSEWFECVGSALATNGSDGEFHRTLTPTTIGRRWLAVADSQSYYCGGAYPDANVRSRAFDLVAGTEVELRDWLNAGAVEPKEDEGGLEGQPDKLTPGFRAYLLARARPLPDCRDAFADAGYWDIGLVRAGLEFTPSLPHVANACEEPVLVRFDALARWLSPRGRAGVGSFRADVGARTR